jgi:phenylalanyl-tRNA synthetase beta chain
MSVMRASLWPGLLSTLIHNVNRQQDRVRIFETGLIFQRVEGTTSQPARLAGLIFGKLQPELWGSDNREVDYFDLKGDVESILDLSPGLGPISFVTESHPALHPGQSAAIHAKGKKIGLMGALSPQLQRTYGFSKRVYLFELYTNLMLEAKIPKMRELSRFPEVGRDLSVVLGEDVSSEQITTAIRDVAGPLLVDLRIFDVYQGDAIEKSKKSVALGLTLQHPSRTLGDEDINGIIDSCVKELQAKFNAKLRN